MSGGKKIPIGLFWARKAAAISYSLSAEEVAFYLREDYLLLSDLRTAADLDAVTVMMNAKVEQIT